VPPPPPVPADAVSELMLTLSADRRRRSPPTSVASVDSPPVPTVDDPPLQTPPDRLRRIGLRNRTRMSGDVRLVTRGGRSAVVGVSVLPSPTAVDDVVLLAVPANRYSPHCETSSLDQSINHSIDASVDDFFVLCDCDMPDVRAQLHHLRDTSARPAGPTACLPACRFQSLAKHRRGRRR